MLFKTTAELRDFIPVTSAFDFNDIKPFIERAEREDIIPYLSQEQYDDLNNDYNNEDVSDPVDADLLKYVRTPLAAIALHKYIPFGNINVGNAGFTVTETSSEKIASQWRTEKLADASLDVYHQGIEQLLLFMEANTAQYTLWFESESYTESKECFINTAIEFSRWFAINKSRRIFVSIKTIMQRMELLHIRSITGQALYDEIKGQIVDDDLSEENKILLDIIRPAVANFTIAIATIELPLLFGRNGIHTSGTRAQTDSSAEEYPANAQQLSALHNHTEKTGENFKSQLKKFLFENHSEYPLYEADTSVYVEPVQGNKPSNTTTNFF